MIVVDSRVWTGYFDGAWTREAVLLDGVVASQIGDGPFCDVRRNSI